jgi:hypothetical protein
MPDVGQKLRKRNLDRIRTVRTFFKIPHSAFGEENRYPFVLDKPEAVNELHRLHA